MSLKAVRPRGDLSANTAAYPSLMSARRLATIARIRLLILFRSAAFFATLFETTKANDDLRPGQGRTDKEKKSSRQLRPFLKIIGNNSFFTL